MHDVTKELDSGEQVRLLKLLGVSTDEMLSPPVFHSITAPMVIRRDFSEFATENVLSAVYNHTTAAYDMSLFDEIIYSFIFSSVFSKKVLDKSRKIGQAALKTFFRRLAYENLR